MTKLDAVNDLLAAIHEAPVVSLSGTSATSSEGRAEAMLDRVSDEIQAEGWLFNTDFNVTLTPDGSDQIDMTDVLDFEVDTTTPYKTKLTIRNGLLWDAENQQNTFTSSVKFKRLVKRVQFSDLPYTAQSYITLTAATRFVKQILGSQALVQYSREDEFKARARFLQDGTVRQRRNYFDSSRSAVWAYRR